MYFFLTPDPILNSKIFSSNKKKEVKFNLTLGNLCHQRDFCFYNPKTQKTFVSHFFET